MIEKLNRDFIVLRASRRTDRGAEGCVADLGFDWKTDYSQELIAKLNAEQAHLLRGVCDSIAVRGQVRRVTDEDVPGVAAWSVGRLRTNYQFYLLTPGGKAIDLEFNPREPKGQPYWRVSWTSRFVMPRLLGPRGRENRINWSVGKADEKVILATLDKVSEKFTTKKKTADGGNADNRGDRSDRSYRGDRGLLIPWQKDASFAVRWAKRDQKRILVVPAPGGRVDRALEKLLSNQEVLSRFHRAYSFLKLDPSQAGALRGKLESLGDGGVLICDIPGSDCAVEWSGREHALTRIVASAPGPLNESTLTNLLAKHAVAIDAPTWTLLPEEEREK